MQVLSSGANLLIKNCSNFTHFLARGVHQYSYTLAGEQAAVSSLIDGPPPAKMPTSF